MPETNYTSIRKGLLALLGQASSFTSIDPLCADSVEMLEAAKETGVVMKNDILQLLTLMPTEKE